MANNLKEIKTTIVGTIFLVIGIGITLFEYFTVQNIDWQHYLLPIGFAVAGVGFLFAPDKILDVMFGWLKKRA